MSGFGYYLEGDLNTKPKFLSVHTLIRIKGRCFCIPPYSRNMASAKRDMRAAIIKGTEDGSPRWITSPRNSPSELGILYLRDHHSAAQIVRGVQSYYRVEIQWSNLERARSHADDCLRMESAPSSYTQEINQEHIEKVLMKRWLMVLVTSRRFEAGSQSHTTFLKVLFYSLAKKEYFIITRKSLWVHRDSRYQWGKVSAILLRRLLEYFIASK